MTSRTACPRCGAPDVDPATCPRCELMLALDSAPVPAWETDVSAITKRFGDYELLEEIGHGGVGVVYKARHTKLNRLVALKLLLLGQFSSEQAVQRFRREAQAAAALRHPGLVAIYDAGETEGQHYLTMELVEGRTLASLLREGPLPPRVAATYGRAMADAVGAAHGAGFVHRDLKPANVLVDAFDQPRITDFGLAKRLDGTADLTQSGHLLGSPNYLAPELTAGGGSDSGPSGDIFSLGAILYECLTGRPPFLGSTVQDTLLNIRGRDPIAPRVLNPKLPRDLETICLKCLEKDPAKRYATAQELADELGRYLDAEPIRARPVSRVERGGRWCARNPALATAYGVALTLLILLAAGGPFAAYRIDQARRRAESEATRANAKELESRRSEYAADMLLAQKFLAENSRGRAVELLEKYRPSQNRGLRGEQALNSSSSTNPQQSETSTATDLRGWEWHHLATQTRGQQLAVLRGHSAKLNDVAFSQDGRWLASGGLDGVIQIWDPQTHRLAKTLELPGSGNLTEIYAVTFSPDGRWLAAGDELGRHVYFWDTGAWTQSFVLTNKYRVNGLAFSPDSRWLATGGHSSYGGIVVWDLAKRVPIADWGQPSLVAIPYALAFTPDSRQLVFDDGAGRLGRWDVTTRRTLSPLPLHEGADCVEKAYFTPDGSRSVTGGRNGIVRVWSLPDWKQIYQLTNEWLLAISSAQQLLVTSSDVDVRTRRLETGELKHRMDGHTATVWTAAVSPTAPILASGSQDHTVRVWPQDPPVPRPLRLLFPTNETRIVIDPQLLPRVSSDGLWAITIQTNGTFTLWDARRLERMKEFTWPVRSLSAMAPAPGGRFVAAGGKAGEVVIMDLVDGQIAAQTRRETNAVFYVGFSPDGSRLLINSRSGDDPSSGYRLEVLNARTLDLIREIPSSGGNVIASAFTPDNRYLALGYWNAAETEVVDLETGRRVTRHTGHSGGRILAIAITPDARLVASSAQDGPVRVWDGRTGQLFGEFRGSWETSQALAFSPDGSRLAVAGNGIDLWDLTTRRLVQTLPTTNQPIGFFHWTPDLKQLTATTPDALFVWPAESYGLSEKATNVLAEELDEIAARRRADQIEILDSDWRMDLPFLDGMIRRGDTDGFWHRARARARASKGDLAGAAHDDPTFAISVRDSRCTVQQLDLTPFYNRTLTADGFGYGAGLDELPIGLSELGGTRFDLRGVVQLTGTCPNHADFPVAVRGIPVHSRARRLHVLQATNHEEKDGTPVGRYVLRYADGETREFPIQYGKDLRNWWTVGGESSVTPNAEIVWRGQCRMASAGGQSLRLWKRTYENPRPDVEIVSLDFISEVNRPAPFLVALTLE